MNPTCAIILIGDEILSGRTKDENLNYIAVEVAKIGVRLQEVRVILDDEKTIIETVNSLRKKYTYVFTTGGIGPTHDDITMKSIAKAFNVNTYRSDDVVVAFKKAYGEDVNKNVFNMADFPVGSTLISNKVSTAPGFQMENVFAMAGIPKVMQVMFAEIVPLLKHGKIVKSKHINISAPESVISTEFEEIQNKYGKIVSLGSYPFKKDGSFCTSLVLRSDDEKLLSSAFNDVKQMLIDLNIEKIEA